MTESVIYIEEKQKHPKATKIVQTLLQVPVVVVVGQKRRILGTEFFFDFDSRISVLQD
jgi:hypothetical protein